MKYRLEYISSDIIEDSYDEGMGESTGCGLSRERVHRTFNSMDEIIAYLEAYHGLSKDINDYDIDGRFINTSRMCANHSEEQNGGWMDPTEKEMEDWRIGKQKLYTEDFTIKFVPDASDDFVRVMSGMLGAAEADGLDLKSNVWRSLMIEAEHLIKVTEEVNV